MRIGILARRIGCSTDALRLYERLGLLRSSRVDNGYRDYPEEAVALGLYIRTAKRLGFTLAEIADQVPQVWPAADPTPALRRVFLDKAAMVQTRIDELVRLKQELLSRANSACPLDGAGTGAVQAAPHARRAPAGSRVR